MPYALQVGLPQVPPAEIPPGYGEDSVEATLQHNRCALQPAATYVLRVLAPDIFHFTWTLQSLKFCLLQPKPA
jgi:hypothetical protein